MDAPPLARDMKTADGTTRVIGSAEEAAFYLLPSVGLTWARKGQTPVLRDGDRYGHRSVISLIAATGDRHDHVQDGSDHGEDVARFVRQIRETSPTPLTMSGMGRRFIAARRSTPFDRPKIMGSSSENSCRPIVRNSMRMSKSGPMSKNMNCKSGCCIYGTTRHCHSSHLSPTSE